MKEENVLNHIKELCEERNWSLYQLAKQSGISYSTLNNLFHRQNIPSIPTLMKLCDGFGITLSEFFVENTATTKELTPKQLELVQRWNELSLQDKELLDAYMQGLEKKRLSD